MYKCIFPSEIRTMLHRLRLKWYSKIGALVEYCRSEHLQRFRGHRNFERQCVEGASGRNRDTRQRRKRPSSAVSWAVARRVLSLSSGAKLLWARQVSKARKGWQWCGSRWKSSSRPTGPAESRVEKTRLFILRASGLQRSSLNIRYSRPLNERLGSSHSLNMLLLSSWMYVRFALTYRWEDTCFFERLQTRVLD